MTDYYYFSEQPYTAYDPALQERIAREEFGMVRGNKELLYRFTDSVSVPAKR